MIEDIAEHIDPRLREISGKVFYSGRTAFSGRAAVYVLGEKPGGDPEEKKRAAETIGSHTEFVLLRAPSEWSAYCDEEWKTGDSKGESPLQRRVQHLLEDHLGLDTRRVPASNLIFTRSRRIAHLGADTGALIEMCWPVHEAVLAALRPRAVICFGKKVGEHVRKRLEASEQIDSFEEQNERKWRSLAWKAPMGVIVFSLRHPSIADWMNPLSDPSPMVASVLDM